MSDTNNNSYSKVNLILSVCVNNIEAGGISLTCYKIA